MASPNQTTHLDDQLPDGESRRLGALRSLVSRQREALGRGLTWLSLFARESGDEFWTFDLDSRELTIYYADDLGFVRHRVVEGAPEGAIEEALVHPSTVAAFRALFEDMLAGKDRSSANVMLKNPSDLAFTWCSLMYRLEYNHDGSPTRAVGVRRELEGLSSSQSWFRAIPSCLYPHLLRASVARVASGRVDSMIWREGGQIRLVRDQPLGRALGETADSLFAKRERQEYLRLLDPENLRRSHDRGRHWLIGRYRTVEHGTARPIRIAVNLRRDALGSVAAYSYVSFSDQRAGWEASIDMTAMRDPETQLYQPEYARLAAQTILRDAAPDNLSALTVIRPLGHQGVPRALMGELATALGVFLDTDCIPYLCDGGLIGAFFASVESGDSLRRRLRSAIAAARESLADAEGDGSGGLSDVTLVAASVIAPSERFDPLVAERQARRTCELADDAGRDVVAQPVELEGACGNGEDDVESPAYFGVGRLSDDELRPFSIVAAAMLNTSSPLQAINAGLRGIGLHHQAHRVYVAMVTNDDSMLTIPFEWTDADTTGIRSRLSNSSVTRFPFIERNIGSRRPLYVSRPRTLNQPGMADPALDPWRFCMITLMSDEDRSLALCIDAPSRNLESWELAQCVGARILHCWRLFSYASARDVASATSDFSSMPGTSELEQLIARTAGGAWSSLGALAIHVPHVSRLVEEKGFTHALQIYGSIKATLEQQFDELPVFHTSDTEFVALYPNSSYHAFIQRCAQARMTLVTTHPHDVQIGSAWSDDASGAWDVIGEAHQIALRDTSVAYDEFPVVGNSSPSLDSSLPDFNPFSKSAALSRRFTVYLQPKIDMRTGELVGAEALARVVGDDGKVGSPANAVSRMERTGEIGSLDYFVFDYMLSLMSSWGQRGYSVPPVSSNFSRTTLLSPTSLASVLAIMSRYPTVPSRLIEMEVTETAIDLGNSTLAELVNRYRALGLRVALDDFGSHYSSVSVLANVHFDTVKLDRSIVSGLPDNEVSRSMIRNIAEICTGQNMTCVAEGVESPEQAAALTKEGCCYCQGFYYDKPMPADLFERKYLVA